MKVQIEATVEKVEQRFANGTGCQGYFKQGTTYETLVKKLGEPNAGPSCDDKVKAEWIIRLRFHKNDPGAIFTIYDYKSSVAPEDNTDWHIGGRDVALVPVLGQVLGIKIEK